MTRSFWIASWIHSKVFWLRFRLTWSFEYIRIVISVINQSAELLLVKMAENNIYQVASARIHGTDSKCPGKVLSIASAGNRVINHWGIARENLLSVLDTKRATESVRGSKSRTEQTPVTFDWNRTALETSPFSSVFVLFCCD